VVSGEELVSLMPALAARAPSAGYLFYDCQTDDARLVLTVLAEAERFGAVFANRLRVTGLVEEAGRARGAIVQDETTGETFPIAASTVVNATGVWADRIRPEELHDEAEVPVIRPSRGTHIVISSERLKVDVGAIAPAGGKRTVFILPWLGQTLVGTTDNDYDGGLDHVRPDQRDVAYLLEATNRFFGTELGPMDVAGAFAGVRPLISTGDPKKSVDISRKAELYETSSGMVTITGGKLTTWRRMAKMTVDRIVERDGRDAPCRTHQILLGMAVDAQDLPRMAGVPEDVYEHLAGRYGYAAHDVLRLAAGEPGAPSRDGPDLAAPIVPGLPDVLAEVAYAARREQAATLGDALLRRTRLGVLAARQLLDPAGDALERVAGAMGSQLGWDEARRRAAVADFRREADLEGIVVAS
jgi:glycerol-3-phosphate dehydrogenase